MSQRYSASELITLAKALLAAAGLDDSKASDVAEILVEGDLLGHTTHGLALLPAYLGELKEGRMAKTGEPAVVADFPAALTWDGRRLPGPWLVRRAFEIATARARQLGTCTVVIKRSHHLACLATYLKPITDQGLVALLTCSDPAVSTVAPHGGRRGVMTPNPYAAAWPTAGEPVVLDVSMSITTNGQVKRSHTEKTKLGGAWLVDAAGQSTDDPAALFTTPAGAILPIGGLDHGHKGYALGLMVEALTAGLAGHGRADPSEGWSATVFLQVLDPGLFGGLAAFEREAGHLAEVCRRTPPIPGGAAVRLPGERGWQRRADQLERGVDLHPGIWTGLATWAEQSHVRLPAPC